ncbi:MAG: carbon-nitrogen hydrolase, partial [Candidatus Omnitrophica bacterium]|nr:carbon-nitrogen hydrolase [Candidatus Omnitrophota bacterium]
MTKIENVELEFLTLPDYEALKEAMIEAYPSMPEAYWKEMHIQALIDKFPEGQVKIVVNGELAGCALAIIVDYDRFEARHTYREVTAGYTFNTHKDSGDVLYGIDVFIKPE